MPLVTTGEDPRLDFRDVVFVMLDDGRRVKCVAGSDVVEDIERSNPTPDERLSIFKRHREWFEARASLLFDAGQQSPVIRTHHLPG